MRVLVCFRYALQLVALVIFLYQLSTAVHKYTSNMTVATVQLVPWKSMKDLSVNLWICALNQYDQKAGLEMGYEYVYAWYAGTTLVMNNGSILNWGGSKNLSSEAAKHQLFPTNYENIGFGYRDLGGSNEDSLKNNSNEEFLFNTGRCRVIKDLKNVIAATYALTDNNGSHQFFVVEKSQSSYV